MQRHLFTILVAVLMAVGSLPLRVSASCATTLTVRLLDGQSNRAGKAQITIQRGDTGASLQATTDAQGTANFDCIDAGLVRILVSGAAPGGQRLFHTGADRGGIRFQLFPGENSLLLRIEPDGAVVPDPTEWASIGSSAPNGDLNGLAGQRVPPAPATARPNRPAPLIPASTGRAQPAADIADAGISTVALETTQATPWPAWLALGGLVAIGLAVAIAYIRLRSAL